MFSELRVAIAWNKEKFSAYLCEKKKMQKFCLFHLLGSSAAKRRDCDLGIEPSSCLGRIIKQLFIADCQG